MSIEADYIPATPDDNVVLLQGLTDQTTFTIGGLVQSTKARIINIFIKTVPEHGTLFTGDKQIIKEGSVLPLPEGQSRIQVHYKSHDDAFFSLPHSKSPFAVIPDPDQFTFELKASHTSTNEMVSNNFFATQEIHVLNVNHRPTLFIPEESVMQIKPALRSGRPTAVVDGIEVLDELDKNINRVRLNLWAESGTLTLNEDSRYLADFDSCNRRWEYDWRCIGDGINDRNMTFLTEPGNVKHILEGLQYESFFDNKDDRITVEVWDGIGGQCIAEEEQAFSDGPNGIRYTSIQYGCYGLEGWVNVVASPDMGPGSGALDNKFLGFSVSNIISWSLYVALTLCFLCSLRSCYRCWFGRRRGTEVTFE